MKPAVRGEIDGLETFWHEHDARGAAPVLYVHGVPTNADVWLPFLERTGGVALDLPGFGRSAKPPDFDYSIPGYRRFLSAFVDERGLDRFSLVVHDWGGGAGLALAQAMPERVERLVVIDAVPLLPGYRWHRIARVWRTPLVGELAMGFTFRWTFKLLSREATTGGSAMPGEFLDLIWRHWDQGTMRAILRLYRSAPPEVLAREGARLGEIGSPALVLWGERDPYLPTKFAHAYGEALGAEVDVLEGGGHWLWLDRPEVIERVARFLAASG
jgi:pimeloyl-ACP methyl ester carboxylesterase